MIIGMGVSRLAGLGKGRVRDMLAATMKASSDDAWVKHTE